MGIGTAEARRLPLSRVPVPTRVLAQLQSHTTAVPPRTDPPPGASRPRCDRRLSPRPPTRAPTCSPRAPRGARPPSPARAAPPPPPPRRRHVEGERPPRPPGFSHGRRRTTSPGVPRGLPPLSASQRAPRGAMTTGPGRRCAQCARAERGCGAWRSSFAFAEFALRSPVTWARCPAVPRGGWGSERPARCQPCNEVLAPGASCSGITIPQRNNRSPHPASGRARTWGSRNKSRSTGRHGSRLLVH